MPKLEITEMGVYRDQDITVPWVKTNLWGDYIFWMGTRQELVAHELGPVAPWSECERPMLDDWDEWLGNGGGDFYCLNKVSTELLHLGGFLRLMGSERDQAGMDNVLSRGMVRAQKP